VTTGVDDGGTDIVFASVNFILGNFLENLTLTGGDPVRGTGNGLNNILNGNGAANTLYALGGNDTLDGKGGADRMFGGAGNDTYYVDTLNELASEQTTAGVDDGGRDLVIATVNFVLGDFIEFLTLSGSAGKGTGNGLNNIINGNAEGNTLLGLDGNDVLSGHSGNDKLTGGGGKDTFTFDHFGAANGVDLVTDFTTAFDHLSFKASDFGWTPGHVLTAAELSLTGVAVGATAQFVFNATTFALSWDSNGNIAGGLTQITSLTGATLATGDFVFT